MSTRSGRVPGRKPGPVESSPPKLRKGVSPPRSPARSRKVSPPARSPSRKSPARKSPARKSPSRQSKYPARKSPSRTTKDSASQSPIKRPPIKPDIELKLQDITSKVESLRSSRSRRSEYTIRDVVKDYGSGEKLNGFESSTKEYGLRNRKTFDDIIPRRSSRLKDVFDDFDKRSLSKSISKSVSQSIDTFSDEESSDDVKKEKSRSITRKLATPIRDTFSTLSQLNSRWEFGGRVGSTALIILLPVTVFAILVSCSKSCSIKPILDIATYKNIVVFNAQATLILAAQYILQAIIACIPLFGPKSDVDESGKKYYFNAFFSTIVTTSLLFTLDFFKIIDSNNLLNNYVTLALTSYAFAVVLAIGLFVASRKLGDGELNPYGNTGNVVNDFFIGREIHPYIKKLDVKIWISRISNITTLVLAILLFKQGYSLPKAPDALTVDNVKEVFSQLKYQPTILVFTMMQIVYILNFIMREHKITSTFYWHSEGIGYLQLVSSALYPFYFTSISKYIVTSNLNLSTNALIASSVVYVIGLVIMIASNNIKNEFRKNPLHPSLMHLESMPTFHGKKLLVSGLWGVVRHPNYAGDMVAHAALAVPGLSAAAAAAAPALLTLLTLLHRAWRDNARCRRRYGAAWQRYCKKVPSVVVPKIL